jgi:hypothetical protein
VVIRTHEKELLQLRSLIYSLRAEREGAKWLGLDFVLVPTEPGAQQTYRALSKGACINRSAGRWMDGFDQWTRSIGLVANPQHWCPLVPPGLTIPFSPIPNTHTTPHRPQS